MTTTKTTLKKDFDFTTVKTFEDACKLRGVDPDDLPGMPKKCNGKVKKAMISSYKLMIIVEAINNDEKFPDVSNYNQAKYYPWLTILSSRSGFSETNCYCEGTNVGVGLLLCFNEREKADYCLKQFKDLWNQWILGI
jgi:hypothetical protein